MTWTSCFAKCNKIMLTLTTCLVAGLGIVYMVLAIIGGTNNFKGATLFPSAVFLLAGILGAIIFITAILAFASLRYPRRLLIYASLFTIIIAFILQSIIGTLIQRKEDNPYGYVWDKWHNNNENYRAHLQDEFHCCGYANVFDEPVISGYCPSYGYLQSNPCFYALTNFVDNHFYQAHSFLFSTLSIDFMALTNAIMMICMLKRKEKKRSTASTEIPLTDTEHPKAYHEIMHP